MQKISKEEVIKLIKDLRVKYTQEELGVMLGRTTQTIWAWSSNSTKRIPAKSDYEVLKRLLVK